MTGIVCRGVRGATTADANTSEAILSAAAALLERMVTANGIEKEDVAAAFFTMSPDLNADFPAYVARQMGWTEVPLLGAQEVDKPGTVEKAIRVLVLWNTARTQDEIIHIYMKGMETLRPDLAARMAEVGSMIIVTQSGINEDELSAVIAWVEDHGYQTHLSKGEERTIIGVVGNGRPLESDQVERMDGVEKTMRVLAPYKLAGRDMHPEPTQFPLNGVTVGAEQVALIAGPCSVESRESDYGNGRRRSKRRGRRHCAAGAFKPRTSPYSFQGMGLKGLELLAEAREATGLPVVTEVMAPDQVSLVAQYADVLQIGAREYAELQSAAGGR